jgi:hypothetical protein
MTTWTIKWETMNGTEKKTSIKAKTDHEAIKQLCQAQKVGNILAVSDCYRVQWV